MEWQTEQRFAHCVDQYGQCRIWALAAASWGGSAARCQSPSSQSLACSLSMTCCRFLTRAPCKARS